MGCSPLGSSYGALSQQVVQAKRAQEEADAAIAAALQQKSEQEQTDHQLAFSMQHSNGPPPPPHGFVASPARALVSSLRVSPAKSHTSDGTSGSGQVGAVHWSAMQHWLALLAHVGQHMPSLVHLSGSQAAKATHPSWCLAWVRSPCLTSDSCACSPLLLLSVC